MFNWLSALALFQNISWSLIKRLKMKFHPIIWTLLKSPPLSSFLSYIYSLDQPSPSLLCFFPAGQARSLVNQVSKSVPPVHIVHTTLHIWALREKKIFISSCIHYPACNKYVATSCLSMKRRHVPSLLLSSPIVPTSAPAPSSPRARKVRNLLTPLILEKCGKFLNFYQPKWIKGLMRTKNT